MLTRIVQNSPKLCAFAAPIINQLSQPQQQHLLNLADGLLVCEEKKTLAALQRQFVEAVDVSNWADFLRISPWLADSIRQTLREQQIKWALEQAIARGEPREIYLNLDDSLGEKGRHTWRLEVVDYYHDHVESTPKQQRYKKGFCYLVCTMRIGQIVVTLDTRLYLRARTVRALNRHRSEAQRLHFRSKNHLARMILTEIAPLLPPGWKVIVQFDSWYASEKVLKFVRRQHWELTCGLPCTRKLNGEQLKDYAKQLWHTWYTPISVTTAAGAKVNLLSSRIEGAIGSCPI